MENYRSKFAAEFITFAQISTSSFPKHNILWCDFGCGSKNICRRCAILRNSAAVVSPIYHTPLRPKIKNADFLKISLDKRRPLCYYI